MCGARMSWRVRAAMGVGIRGTAGWLRRVFLAALALDVALIVGRVALYRALLAQQDWLFYVCEPLALLVMYAGIALAITRWMGAREQRTVALGVGVRFGVVTGALWVINVTIETFVNTPSSLSILSTAPFILGTFALWGVAGFVAAWRTQRIVLGALAAVWSAMVGMLVGVTYGFTLSYTALPRLTHAMYGDPDFLRSHWTDAQAFAIANTFGNGFSHLLGALLIGSVIGGVGAVAGAGIAHWAQARRTLRQGQG